MGLPTRHIVIRDEQWSLMQRDVWSDTFVDAFWEHQGRYVPIKLRYRGGHTRDYPKKSFEIVWGNVTKHLNAEYDDPSMIRNALSFRFFEWIGVPSPKTTHCILKLNDQNIGVYLEIEAVDRNFFRRRGIPVHSLVYAVNDSADFSLQNPDNNKPKSSLFNGYQLMIGRHNQGRERLKRFISNLNTLSSPKLEAYLSSYLDIEQYLRWLAGAVFTGNYDGFDQNYAIYLHKLRNKYRIIPWDYEGTWGRNCYGKKCGSDLVRVSGYNTLTYKLLANKNVRLRYKLILQEILRTSFHEKRLAPVIQSMHKNISPYIHNDSLRKWSHSTFDGEPKFILNYIAERRGIIRQGLSKL